MLLISTRSISKRNKNKVSNSESAAKEDQSFAFYVSRDIKIKKGYTFHEFHIFEKPSVSQEQLAQVQCTHESYDFVDKQYEKTEEIFISANSKKKRFESCKTKPKCVEKITFSTYVHYNRSTYQDQVNIYKNIFQTLSYFKFNSKINNSV